MEGGRLGQAGSVGGVEGAVGRPWLLAVLRRAVGVVQGVGVARRVGVVAGTVGVVRGSVGEGSLGLVVVWRVWLVVWKLWLVVCILVVGQGL